MRHIFQLRGETLHAALAGPPERRRLLLGDGSHDIAMAETQDGHCHMIVDGSAYNLHVATAGDRCFVHVLGETIEILIRDPVDFHARAGGTTGTAVSHAPMPGTVIAIPVQVGSTVQEGDALVVLESMKLEVTLRAEIAGTVAEIAITAGQAVEKDALLVRLTAMATA